MSVIPVGFACVTLVLLAQFAGFVGKERGLNGLCYSYCSSSGARRGVSRGLAQGDPAQNLLVRSPHGGHREAAAGSSGRGLRRRW
jgi:hypothetical protein